MTPPKTPASPLHHAANDPLPHVADASPLSLNDVLSAFAAVHNQNEPSLQRVFLPVAVALMIGILGWVGTTLSTLNMTVATMQPTLAIIQKSVDGLSLGQKDMQDKIADMQTKIGQDDMRLNALEERRKSP